MSKAPAVDYALQIVEQLARSEEGEGISSLSAATGINKNAVSRILEALTEGGWAYCPDPDRRRYALTLRPFTLLSQGMDARDLLRAADPYVRELNASTLDSAYLAVPDGEEAAYLLHLESRRDVRISGRVGGRYPLYCSAPGKVLLAWGPEERLAAAFKAPERRTPRTVVSRAAFEEERACIREQGFAVDNEEFGKGILCVAAPVFDATDRVVAAVGVTGSTVYDDIDRFSARTAPAVVAAAAHITAILGGKING